MKLTRSRVSGAAFGAAICGMLAATALGSPPSGIQATNLIPTADLDKRLRLNSDQISLRTKVKTDIRVQTLTFAPGGRTGWHHHPGIVLVAVQSGEVTVYDADCDTRTYKAGQAFTESGDRPLEVRNNTAADATVYATFIAPSPDPGTFRIEDDVRDCP